MTDAERIEFMATHSLAVSANDFGEWQVFELAPKYYGDGIVTRNAFFLTPRDAIDWAMSHYIGVKDEEKL